MTAYARGRRVAFVAIGVGGLALAGAAVVYAVGAGSTTTGQATPVINTGVLPTTSVAPRTQAAKPHPTMRRHLVPTGSRLRYPRLDIDAPVVRTTVRNGVMDVPRDPRTVGWWTGGAGPGDAAGSAVVVGHVNYSGTAGALGVLPHARPGDHVSIAEPGRIVTYRVVAVRTYPKTAGIPVTAFARAGPPRLVLITCGGSFDASSGNYRDNIVVYAVPG